MGLANIVANRASAVLPALAPIIIQSAASNPRTPLKAKEAVTITAARLETQIMARIMPPANERIGTSYSDCEKAHKFGFSYISDKQPYLKLLFPTDSDTKNKNEERIDIEKQFNEKTDFFMVDKFRALVAEEPQEKTNKK